MTAEDLISELAAKVEVLERRVTELAKLAHDHTFIQSDCGAILPDWRKTTPDTDEYTKRLNESRNKSKDT